jgi:hypothetical protein
MGRTGRKRDGRCVLLLTEGPEENTYKKSQTKKKSIFKTIMEKQATAFRLYPNNPMLLPEGARPNAVFESIVVPKFVNLDAKKKRKKAEYVLICGNEVTGIFREEVVEDDDDGLYLTKEQEEYYFDNFALTEAELKEAEINPNYRLSDQCIATPIWQVTHSLRTVAFINTVKFAQEQLIDGEDMFGVEVVSL